MKILIDTNVILDFLLERAPFYEDSVKLMRIIDKGDIQAYITANSITDIIYIARKKYTLDEIRRAILCLLEIVNIIGIDRDDIMLAFELGFDDFEDALQSACSVKAELDNIITRNKKDFLNSKIPAINLIDFLNFYTCSKYDI